MLDSLQIKGFKLFRELTVPKLARLNLFVGANNAGKSCLLEAIRIYSSAGNIAVLRDIVRARDGDWEAKMNDRTSEAEDASSVIENPIRFLFHGFHCQVVRFFFPLTASRPQISIGPADGAGKLSIAIGLYRESTDEDGVTRRALVDEAVGGTRKALGLDEYATDDNVDEFLELSVNSSGTALYRLEGFWPRRSILRPRPFQPPEMSRRVVNTVSTSGLTANEVSFLWDRISLTPQQDKILDCLRMIEPRIEALTLIGQSDRLGDRTPVVKMTDGEERLPLKAMGDGLTRLFHIALSMVNAQNGVLLIDEFENGLYWEVQEQLWPLIFAMAEDLDVQLFATTHSKDCIKGFADAWSHRPEMGAMYRLERSADLTRARPLPMVNVSDALASEVEVR